MGGGYTWLHVATRDAGYVDLVIAEARQDDKRWCGSEHDCWCRRRLALQPPWPVLWLGGHAAALLEPCAKRLQLLNPGSHAAGLSCSDSLAGRGEASGAEQQCLTAAGGRQTQRERGQQEVLHVLGLGGSAGRRLSRTERKTGAAQT